MVAGNRTFLVVLGVGVGVGVGVVKGFVQGNK